MSKIAELLEKIAEAMVFMDTENVQDIAGMHSNFEELSSGLKKEGNEAFYSCSCGIEDLLKDLLMEEVADKDAALAYINACIVAFQEVYRDGRDAGSVTLPDVSGNGAGGAADSGFRLPDNVDESIFTEFISRQAPELLEFEAQIMALDSADRETQMPAMKRYIHTLKGESALMGLSEAEEVCHRAEDIIEIGYSPELTDQLLHVKDWLMTYFSYFTGAYDKKPDKHDILEELRSFSSGEKAAKVTGTSPAPKAVEEDEEDKEEVIKSLTEKFNKSSNPLQGDLDLLGDFILETGEHLENADTHLIVLENDPQNDESVNAVFRAFHTIKGVAGFLDLTMIGTLAHEAENLLDRARKHEIRFAGFVSEVAFKSLDKLRQLVGDLQQSMASGDYHFCDPGVPELIYAIRQVLAGKIDESEYDISIPDVEEVVAEKEVAGAEAIHEVDTAGRAAGQQGVKIKEFVKVDSERLDKLVNTIGEMVIVETMVAQLMADVNSDEGGQINARLSQMNKITRELQEMGTSLRMVPVKPVFQKMARLVRDLSKKMRKPVNFVMTGEDTELDKTVVDMIGDPLVHLVRNSMDHGIESSVEERRKKGKPDMGRVELRSFNAGGNIYLEIEDDGKGLDKEAILAKAIKQGLVKETDKLSDRDIYNLIFEAGFSTAAQVTDVSGRGVGMDVVRKNIASLRGRVEIASETGKGSTISIVLPLTLAIIEGMIIQVGTEKYIIPTLSIITSIRPDDKMINTVMKKGEMLDLQGELIPMFRLERLFNVTGAITDPTEGLIVVVEYDGMKAGLLTDRLLGQSQIVIKSLGESMQGIDGISGGAILPDGKVGLILDMGGIIKIAHNNAGLLTEQTVTK